MSICVHHVSGRLRVRVMHLTSNAAVLNAQLTAIPGVTSVECRSASSSVVVRYDPQTTDFDAVMEVLSCEAHPPVQPARKADPIAPKLMKRVLWLAAEKAAEHMLAAALSAAL